MKSFVSACVALVCCLMLPASALADGWSFTENQNPNDDFVNIAVAGAYSALGQPPRDNNSGVGTIKVSLPRAIAQFDPAGATDVPGYICSTTTSAYGESGTGFVCSIDGTPQGGGTAFPTSVTLRLTSATCYTPPPRGDSQPGLVQIWAAPFEPGTPPDASYPIEIDDPCANQGDGGPEIEEVAPQCVVPNVKGRTLASAVVRLTDRHCRKGRVTYAFSPKVRKGRVVKQSKKAGKRLPQRAKINLVVSKGPKRKRS